MPKSDQHPEEGIESTGHLLDNVLLFGRLLRGLGLDVSSDRIMDLIRALDVINLNNRDDFYFAACASLVSGKSDLPLFDAAFEAFWRIPSRGSHRQSVTVSGMRPPQPHPVVLPPALPNHPDNPEESKQPSGEEQPPTVIEVTASYSARAAIHHKDFSDLTDDEIEEVKHLIASFVWHLGERRTRRYQLGGEMYIDMRRTVRRNLRYGGEIIQWVFREPAYKPRPLVLIADISGSMDSYTRLLIRFCYSMARSLQQPVETFLFSTELTRVTRELRHRDIDQALTGVGQTVNDWSGGTRIGQSIKTFNYEWGQRVLGRGAVVILISDGWDRGDVDLLQREMARLKRSCYRLIWLNPLLGGQDYEPTARGMAAALPHIHDFLPVHNLASLESLAAHLASLKDR